MTDLASRVGLLAAAWVALHFPAAASGQRTPEDSPRPGAVTAFPDGRLFRPISADPKEPRFSASVLRSRSEGLGTTLAAVAMGDELGLVRWGEADGDRSTQLGITAGVLAQFDLETNSFDLVNADYLVGFVLASRRGRVSGRLKLYHQSSHLGDEFLLRTRPERVNLSYEALEAVVAVDGSGWRAYAGGEQTLHRFPATAPKRALRVGLEYVQPDAWFHVGRLGAARLLLAGEARGLDGVDDRVGWSGRLGLEVRPADPSREGDGCLTVLLEAYDGPSPYGQFYERSLRVIGAGLRVGF